ncbi:MAG TPA: cation acetate symporter [Actinomycetes bacterium]|nr:cation acetate symporter [Actinomycetes bacterium]
MSGTLLAFNLLLIFVVAVLGITYWAARRTRTLADYYVAGHALPAWQNGIAIAAVFISAASVLGLPGLIALQGFDGLFLLIGVPVSFLVVQFLLAEPLRNTGRYTIADAMVHRLRQRPVRLAASVAVLCVCLIHLTAQMMAAGALAQQLFGLRDRVLGIGPDAVGIVLVGVVAMICVVAGGMLGVTWLQLVKALLLVAVTSLLVLLLTNRLGFSVGTLLGQAVARSGRGEAFLRPGLWLGGGLDTLSLAIGLVLGTAGLPHVMTRFYAVRGTREVRSSVNWAMLVTGVVFLLVSFIGLAAAALLGGPRITAVDRSGTLAVPLLARELGGGLSTFGGDLLVACVALTVFATILGTVAGLTIAAASSVAHDVYASVLHPGRRAEAREAAVARLAGVVISVVAILVGVALREVNAALVGSVALGLAASSLFPALILSLYWRGLNTAGAVAAIVAGMLSSLVLTALGSTVIGPSGFILRDARPVLPLAQPAIISVPLAFFAAWLGTWLSAERPPPTGSFAALRLRALTGVNQARADQPRRDLPSGLPSGLPPLSPPELHMEASPPAVAGPPGPRGPGVR